METDTKVDNSITSSSRVNERLTTPFYFSVHFNSPELPCAGIPLSSTFGQVILGISYGRFRFRVCLGVTGAVC